jgi:hypothetical protein
LAYTKLGNARNPRHYYSGDYYKAIYFFQGLINDILLGTLKISRADVVEQQVHHRVKKESSSQYFVVKNPAGGNPDTTRIMSTGVSDSITYRNLPILYDQIVPYHRLPFYILSRNQDSLMIEIWPPPRTLQNSNFDRQQTAIDQIPNGALYNHDKVAADTFYAVIPWRNQGIGPRFQTFNLLFGTKYLIAVSAPIGYTFAAKAWQSNFVNAGVAYGWGKGRTKFYRDNLQTARNFYWGAGFIAGVSSISISSSTVDTAFSKSVPSSYNLPGVYTGVHIGASFNSVQLMLTGAFQWAIGKNSGHWLYQGKFTLGVAIGLSGFNLLVPNSASAPLTH